MRTLRKVFEKERERDAHFLLHTATIAIDAHTVRLKMAFDFFLFFLSFFSCVLVRLFDYFFSCFACAIFLFVFIVGIITRRRRECVSTNRFSKFNELQLASINL